MTVQPFVHFCRSDTKCDDLMLGLLAIYSFSWLHLRLLHLKAVAVLF
jgi:hypothetical protein